MKKITVINAKEVTETGENEDRRLCKFEIEGPEEMDASDGYHTFTELYAHRIALYIALCKWFTYKPKDWRHVWRSKLHADGSSYDGWFIMGIGDANGEQISYHLPMSEWENTEWAETRDKAPEWDGHTPTDVVARLKEL